MQEVKKYGIQNLDTLTDISCGLADHDRVIANMYPNLFFVLENKPVHNRVNVKKYLARELKNNSFTPRIAQHYRFVERKDSVIQLKDNSCKVVLCRKVIHEFGNISFMAGELARITASGGTLIVVEADPVLSGPIDPRCKKPVLSKTSIDSLFKLHALTLVSSDTIDYDGTEVLNIMRFSK